MYSKPPRRSDKVKEVQAFNLWLQQRSASSDLVIYSDGSQIRNNGELRTGWGVSIREGDTSREVYTKAGKLLQAEVFDAEVYAALQGLAAATTIAPERHLYVCLDNTSVVDGLNGRPPESSQAVFLRFHVEPRLQ